MRFSACLLFALWAYLAASQTSAINNVKAAAPVVQYQRDATLGSNPPRAATVTGTIFKRRSEIDVRSGLNLTIEITLCSEQFHPNMARVWLDKARYDRLLDSIVARDVKSGAVGVTTSAQNRVNGWNAQKRQMLPPQAISMPNPKKLVLTFIRRAGLDQYDIDQDEFVRIHLHPDVLVNCSIPIRAHPEIVIEATIVTMTTSTSAANKTTLNECEIRSCQHYALIQVRGGLWSKQLGAHNAETLALIDGFTGWIGNWKYRADLDGKNHTFATHMITRVDEHTIQLRFSEEMYNTDGRDTILGLSVLRTLITGYDENRVAVLQDRVGRNVTSNTIFIMGARFKLLSGSEWTEDEIQTGIHERSVVVEVTNGWMRTNSQNLEGQGQQIRDAIRATRQCVGSNGLCDEQVFDALFRVEYLRVVADPSNRIVSNDLDNDNEFNPRYFRLTFSLNPWSTRYAIPNGQESFNIAFPASATCANRPVTVDTPIIIKDTPQSMNVTMSPCYQTITENRQIINNGRRVDVPSVSQVLMPFMECCVKSTDYAVTIQLRGDAFDLTEGDAKSINDYIATPAKDKARFTMPTAFLTAFFQRAPLGLNPDLTGENDKETWNLRVPSYFDRLEDWKPRLFNIANLKRVDIVTAQKIMLTFSPLSTFDIPSFVREGATDLSQRPTPVVNNLDYAIGVTPAVVRSRTSYRSMNKITVYGGHAKLSGGFNSGTGKFARDGAYGFNVHELDVLNGNVNLTITLYYAQWRYATANERRYTPIPASPALVTPDIIPSPSGAAGVWWENARTTLLQGMVSETDVKLFTQPGLQRGRPCTTWDSQQGITLCNSSYTLRTDLRRDYGWNARKMEIIPTNNIFRIHDDDRSQEEGRFHEQVFLKSVPVVDFLIVEHNRPSDAGGVGDVAAPFEQIHVYLDGSLIECGNAIYAGAFRIMDDNVLTFINPYENECDVIDQDATNQTLQIVNNYASVQLDTTWIRSTMMLVLKGGIWSENISKSYAPYVLELLPDALKDYICVEDIFRVNNTHLFIIPTDTFYPDHDTLKGYDWDADVPAMPRNARGKLGKLPITQWMAPTTGSGTTLNHEDTIFDWQFPTNVNNTASQVFFKGSFNSLEQSPASLPLAFGNKNQLQRSTMRVIYSRHNTSSPFRRNMSESTADRILGTSYSLQFVVNEGTPRDPSAAFTENELNYGYTGKWDQQPRIKVLLKNGRFWPENSIQYANKFAESRYWLRSSIANLDSPQEWGWPNRTQLSGSPTIRYGIVNEVVDQLLPLGTNRSYQAWWPDARYAADVYDKGTYYNIPTDPRSVADQLRYGYPIHRVNDTYVAMTFQPGHYYYIDDGSEGSTKDDKLTFTLQHARPTMGVIGAVCSNSPFRDYPFTIVDTPEKFYVRQDMQTECDVSQDDPVDKEQWPDQTFKMQTSRTILFILEGARWNRFVDTDDYLMHKLLRGPQCSTSSTSGKCGRIASPTNDDKTPTDLTGPFNVADTTTKYNFRDSTNMLWRVFNITRINERTVSLRHREFFNNPALLHNAKTNFDDWAYGYSIWNRAAGKTPQFVLDPKLLMTTRVGTKLFRDNLRTALYDTTNFIHLDDLVLSRVALDRRLEYYNPYFLNDDCAALKQVDCQKNTKCVWYAVDQACYNATQDYLQFEAVEARVTTSISNNEDSLNYDPVIPRSNFIKTGYYGDQGNVADANYRTTPLIGEMDIHKGGVVLTLTLRNGMWITNINCSAIRDSMVARRGNWVNGIQLPKYGWNKRIREIIRPQSCRRVNDTVLTVTLFADHGYAIAGKLDTTSNAEDNTATYPDNGDEIIDVNIPETQVCKGRNLPPTTFHIRNQRTSIRIISPESECDVTGGPKWGPLNDGQTSHPDLRRRGVWHLGEMKDFQPFDPYFSPKGFTMKLMIVGDSWTPQMQGVRLAGDYVSASGTTSDTPWNTLKASSTDPIRLLVNELTFDQLLTTRTSATAATAATEDDMWARSLARLVRYKSQIRVTDNFTLYIDLWQQGDVAHKSFSILNHPIREGAELGNDAARSTRGALVLPGAAANTDRYFTIPALALRGGNLHKVGASGTVTGRTLLSPPTRVGKTEYLYLVPNPDVIETKRGTFTTRTGASNNQIPAVVVSPPIVRSWIQDSSNPPKITYTLNEVMHLQGNLTNATSDNQRMKLPLYFVIDLEFGTFHYDASNDTSFAEALRDSFIANYDAGRRGPRNCDYITASTMCHDTRVTGGYCEWAHPTLTTGSFCRDRRFVKYAWNSRRARILPTSNVKVFPKDETSWRRGLLNRATIQIAQDPYYATMMNETITLALNNFTLCGDNYRVFPWRQDSNTEVAFTVMDSLPLVTVVHNFGECSLSGEGYMNYLRKYQRSTKNSGIMYDFPKLDTFPYNKTLKDYFYIDVLVEGDGFLFDPLILGTLNETFWASDILWDSNVDDELKRQEEFNQMGLVKYLRASDAVWKWVGTRQIRIFPNLPGSNQTGFQMASAIVMPMKFVARVFKAWDGGTRITDVSSGTTTINPWARIQTITSDVGGSIFVRPTLPFTAAPNRVQNQINQVGENKLSQNTDYTPLSNARDSVWVYGTQICRLRGGSIEPGSCYFSNKFIMNQTRVTWKVTTRLRGQIKTVSSEDIRVNGFNPYAPTENSVSSALSYALTEDNVYYGNSTITLSIIGGWFNVYPTTSYTRKSSQTDPKALDRRLRQSILDALQSRNAENHGWNARVDCGSVTSARCKYSPTLQYASNVRDKFRALNVNDITVGPYQDVITIKLRGDWYYAISADEIIDLMFTPREVCGNTIMAAPGRPNTWNGRDYRNSRRIMYDKVFTPNVPIVVQNLKTELDIEGGQPNMWLYRTPSVQLPRLRIDECWIYSTSSSYTPVATLALKGDIWNDDNSIYTNTNGTAANLGRTSAYDQIGYPNKVTSTFRGIDVGKYLLPDATRPGLHQYIQMFYQNWNVTLTRDLKNTRLAYLFIQPMSVPATAKGDWPFTQFTKDFDLNMDLRTSAAGGVNRVNYIDLVTYDRNGIFSQDSSKGVIRFPTDVFAALSHKTCDNVVQANTAQDTTSDCARPRSHRKADGTTDEWLTVGNLRIFQTTANLTARMRGSTRTLSNDVNSDTDANRIVIDEDDFRSMATTGGITLTITLSNGTFNPLTSSIRAKIIQALNVTKTGARLGSNKEYNARLTGFQSALWNLAVDYGSGLARIRSNKVIWFNRTDGWTSAGYNGRDIWLGSADKYGKYTKLYITLSAPANTSRWNYAIGEDEYIDINLPKEAVCGREIRPWSGYVNVGNIRIKDRPTKVRQVWEDISTSNGECTVNGYAQPTFNRAWKSQARYRSQNGSGFGYGRLRFIIDEGDVWHPELGKAPPTLCNTQNPLTTNGWVNNKGEPTGSYEHPTCALWRELAFYWRDPSFYANPSVFIYRRSPRVVEFFAPRIEWIDGQYEPHLPIATDLDGVLRLPPQLFVGYDLYQKPIAAHSVAYSNTLPNKCSLSSSDDAVCKTNQLVIRWKNVTVRVEPANITEEAILSGRAVLNFTLLNGGTWRWWTGTQPQRVYTDATPLYDNGEFIGNSKANPSADDIVGCGASQTFSASCTTSGLGTAEMVLQKNIRMTRNFVKGLRGSKMWNSYVNWMLASDSVWTNLNKYFVNVTANFLSLRLPSPKYNLTAPFLADDQDETYMKTSAFLSLTGKTRQQAQSGLDFFFVNGSRELMCPKLLPMESDVTCAHHTVTGNCIDLIDSPASATITEDITEQCGLVGSGGRRITITLQNEVWRDLSDFDAPITSSLLRSDLNGYNFMTGEFCTLCTACTQCIGGSSAPITLLDVLRHRLDTRNVRDNQPLSQTTLSNGQKALAAARWDFDENMVIRVSPSEYFQNWVAKPTGGALASHYTDETERGLASFITTRNIQRSGNTLVITFPIKSHAYLTNDFVQSTVTIPYQLTKGYNSKQNIVATPSTLGQTDAISIPMARAWIEGGDNNNRFWTCTEDQLSTGRLNTELCSFVIQVNGTSLVPPVGIVTDNSLRMSLLANLSSTRTSSNEAYGWSARRQFFAAGSVIEVLSKKRVRITLTRDIGYMIFDDEILNITLPPQWVCHNRYLPDYRAATRDGWNADYYEQLRLGLVVKNVNARVGITSTPSVLDECTVTQGAFTVTMTIVGDIWNPSLVNTNSDSFRAVARALGADQAVGSPSFSFYRFRRSTDSVGSDVWTDSEKRLARLGNQLSLIRRVDWRTLVLHFNSNEDYEIWEDVEYSPFTGKRYVGDSQSFVISSTELSFKIQRDNQNVFVTWPQRQASSGRNIVNAERWSYINTLNLEQTSSRYGIFKHIEESTSTNFNPLVDVGIIHTTKETKSLVVRATRVFFSSGIANDVITSSGLNGNVDGVDAYVQSLFKYQLVDAKPKKYLPVELRQAGHPLSSYSEADQTITGPYPTENDIVSGGYSIRLSVVFGKFYGTWNMMLDDVNRAELAIKSTPIPTDLDRYDLFRSVFVDPKSDGVNNMFTNFSHLRGNVSYDSDIPFTGGEPGLSAAELRKIQRQWMQPELQTSGNQNEKVYKKSIMPRSRISRADSVITVTTQAADEYTINFDEYWVLPSSVSDANYLRFPGELFCGNKRSPGLIPLNTFRIVNSPTQVHITDTLTSECDITHGYQTVTFTIRGDLWSDSVSNEVNKAKGWFPDGYTQSMKDDLWTNLAALVGGNDASTLKNALLWARRQVRSSVTSGSNHRNLLLFLSPDPTYQTNKFNYYEGIPCHVRDDNTVNGFKCTLAGKGRDVPKASPTCSWIEDPTVAFNVGSTSGFRCVASSTLSTGVASSLVFYSNAVSDYCLTSTALSETSFGKTVWTYFDETRGTLSRQIYLPDGTAYRTVPDPASSCLTLCPPGGWRLACTLRRLDIEPITAVLEGSFFNPYYNVHFAQQPTSFQDSKYYLQGWVSEEQIQSTNTTSTFRSNQQPTRYLVVRMIGNAWFKRFGKQPASNNRYTRLAVDGIRRILEGHRKETATSQYPYEDGYDITGKQRAGFAEAIDADPYFETATGFPAPPRILTTPRGTIRSNAGSRRTKWFDPINVRFSECKDTELGYQSLDGTNTTSMCKVLNFTNIPIDNDFWINADQIIAVGIPRTLTCGNGVADSRWNLLDTGIVNAGFIALTNVPTKVSIIDTKLCEEEVIVGAGHFTVRIRGDRWVPNIRITSSLYNQFVSESVLGRWADGGITEFLINDTYKESLTSRDIVKIWPVNTVNVSDTQVQLSSEAEVQLKRGWNINNASLYIVPLPNGFDGSSTLKLPASLLAVSSQVPFPGDNDLAMRIKVTPPTAYFDGPVVFKETDISNPRRQMKVRVCLKCGTWAFDVASNKFVRDLLIQGLSAANKNLTEMPSGWEANQRKFEQMVQSESLDMDTLPTLNKQDDFMFYSGVRRVSGNCVDIVVACNPFYAIHRDEEIRFDIPREALNVHHGISDVRTLAGERIRILDVPTRVRLIVNRTQFGNNRIYKDIITECHVARGMQTISIILEGDTFHPNWRSAEFYNTVMQVLNFTDVGPSNDYWWNTRGFNQDGWQKHKATIAPPQALEIDDIPRSRHLWPAGVGVEGASRLSWGLPPTPNVLRINLQKSLYSTVNDERIDNLVLPASLLNPGYAVATNNTALPIYALEMAPAPAQVMPVAGTADPSTNTPKPTDRPWIATSGPSSNPVIEKVVVVERQSFNSYYDNNLDGPFHPGYDAYLRRSLTIYTARINITGTFVELNRTRPSICEREVRGGGMLLTVTVTHDWFRPEIGNGKLNCYNDLFLQGFLSNVSSLPSYWNERMYRGKYEGDRLQDAAGPLQQETTMDGRDQIGDMYRPRMDRPVLTPTAGDIWRNSEMDNQIIIRLNSDWKYDITNPETVTLTVAKNLLGCTLCGIEAYPKMEIWPDESLRVLNWTQTEADFASNSTKIQATLVAPCQRFRREIGTDIDNRNITNDVINGLRSISHRASSYVLNSDGTARFRDSKATSTCGTDGACLRSRRNAECERGDVACYGFNNYWPLTATPANPCDVRDSLGRRTLTNCRWNNIITNVRGPNEPNNTLIVTFRGADGYIASGVETLQWYLSNNTLLRSTSNGVTANFQPILDLPPVVSLVVGTQAVATELLNSTAMSSDAIAFPTCSPTTDDTCPTRLYVSVKYDSFLASASSATVINNINTTNANGDFMAYKNRSSSTWTVVRPNLGDSNSTTTDESKMTITLSADQTFVESAEEQLTITAQAGVLVKGASATSNIITVLPPQPIFTVAVIVDNSTAANAILSEDILNGWVIGNHDLFCMQSATDAAQFGFPRARPQTLKLEFRMLPTLNFTFTTTLSKADIASLLKRSNFRSSVAQPNGFQSKMATLITDLQATEKTLTLTLAQDSDFTVSSDEIVQFILPTRFSNANKIGYPTNNFVIQDTKPTLSLAGTMVSPLNWNTINYLRYGNNYVNLTVGLMGDIWSSTATNYSQLLTNLPLPFDSVFVASRLNSRTLKLVAKKNLDYSISSDVNVVISASSPLILDASNKGTTTLLLRSAYSNTIPSYTDLLTTIQLQEDILFTAPYATSATAGADNLEGSLAPWASASNQNNTMRYIFTTQGINTSTVLSVSTVSSNGVISLQSATNFNMANAVQTYVALRDFGEKYGPNTNNVDAVGLDSCRHIFTLSVAPVNDAPAFTVLTPEVSIDFTTSAVRIAGYVGNRTNGGADEANQVITYTVAPVTSTTAWTNAFTVLPTIDARTGDLTFTPKNSLDRTEVKITAKDDGSCVAPNVCEYSVTFFLTFKPQWKISTNTTSNTFTDCQGIQVITEFPTVPNYPASDPRSWKIQFQADTPELDLLIFLQNSNRLPVAGDTKNVFTISQNVAVRLTTAKISVTFTSSELSYTLSITIRQVESTTPITVSIVGFEIGTGSVDTPYELNPSLDLPVRAYSSFDGCSTPTYRWSCKILTKGNASCDQALFLHASREKTLTLDYILSQTSLDIPKGFLELGEMYALGLRMTLKSRSAFAEVALKAYLMPLEAKIIGGLMRYAWVGAPTILDGSKSRDYADVDAATCLNSTISPGCTYTWVVCLPGSANASTGVPMCNGDIPAGAPAAFSNLPSSPILTFPVFSSDADVAYLTAKDRSFLFQLTVSRTVFGKARTDVTAIQLFFVNEPVPDLFITYADGYVEGTSLYHSVGQRLQLRGTFAGMQNPNGALVSEFNKLDYYYPLPPAGLPNYPPVKWDFKWTVSPTLLAPPYTQSPKDKTFIGSDDRLFVTVNGDAVSADVIFYYFDLTATNTHSGLKIRTRARVIVNKAPDVSKCKVSLTYTKDNATEPRTLQANDQVNGLEGSLQVCIQPLATDDTPPASTELYRLAFVSDIDNIEIPVTDPDSKSAAYNAIAALGKYCITTGTPFVSRQSTVTFRFWVQDILSAQASVAAVNIVVLKPSKAAMISRLNDIASNPTPDLGQVLEAAGIIGTTTTDGTLTDAEKGVVRTQIAKFATYLTNVTIPSKDVSAQQQLGLAVLKMTQNTDYISADAGGNITLAVDRLFDVLVQGKRGADRTVVLACLQTLTNVASAGSLTPPAVTSEQRQQFESNYRAAVDKARVAMMFRMVDGEQMTIPSPDDANWYRNPKVDPPITITQQMEPAVRVDSTYFGIGHPSEAKGQTTFRSSSSVTIESAVKAHFGATTQHRRLLDLQSPQFPGCVVGTVRYRNDSHPFSSGTGSNVILSPIYSQFFDCRADEAQNYEKVTMTGLTGRIEMTNTNFDVNTMCADYSLSTNSWGRTGSPTFKTASSVQTTICSYSVMANNMAILYQKYIPPQTPLGPSFVSDDFLAWWGILLIILACFACIYILVFTYIKVLYKKPTEDDSKPINESAEGSGDVAADNTQEMQV
eukprot:PhF_6_TR15937/c0_g1_i1/m.24750